MRNLLIIFVFAVSCLTHNKHEEQLNSNFLKYELAYNSLTEKENKLWPFWEDYNSDASGVKIIPRVFILKKYSVYGSEYFNVQNSYQTNEILNLSKKFANPKWRKDKNYRVLKPEEVKKFHGPLKYIYFSEIKNDSLRADILGNPTAEYLMTTCERYLIVFEKDSIKSVERTISHFD